MTSASPPTVRTILYGVTAPGTALRFLAGQLSFVGDHGLRTALLAPDTPDAQVSAFAHREGAEYFPVTLERIPSVRGDVRAAVRVLAVTRRLHPDVVIAGTPKMSLLLLTSAWLLRIRHRIYLCHGLRFEGAQGRGRKLLKALERVLVAMSTVTVAVSPSVRDGLVGIGANGRKVTVLGPGSANGIDLDQFRPADRAARVQARERFGIGPNDFVFAFVGRLTHDKGLAHLHASAEMCSDAHFLVAGPPEPAGTADEELINSLGAMPNVHLLGTVSGVQEVYWAADCLVLPTVREGMPTVVLEAGACAVPTVARYATGTRDAIVPDVTGALVTATSPEAFARAACELRSDVSRCSELGSNARDHVAANYERSSVWQRWVTLLDALDRADSLSPHRG